MRIEKARSASARAIGINETLFVGELFAVLHLNISAFHQGTFAS